MAEPVFVPLGSVRHGGSPTMAPPSKPSCVALTGPVVNLMTAAAGAGLLTFPWATKKLGVVLMVSVTVLFACCNMFTDMVLVLFARRHAATMKEHTFEELVDIVVPRRSAYSLALTCVILNSLGALIGFEIIAGDLLVPLADRLFGADAFLADRRVLIALFGMVLGLPLSMLPNMHSLRCSSTIAMATVLFVAGVVVARGIEHRAGLPPSHTEDVMLASSSPDLFAGLPIAVFTLGNQLNVPPLYAHMPSQVKPHAKTVVIAAVSGCVCLYFLVGICGYLNFLGDTEGDILKNYTESTVFMDSVKAVMGFHILLAFPVVCLPARDAVVLFVERSAEVTVTRRTRLALVVVLVMFTTGVAIAVPQVNVVFGLIGSTVSVGIIYLLPAAMLLSDDAVASLLYPEGFSDTHRRWASKGLFGFGVAVGVVSTIVTIADMV